jgi:YD repeat-containing protein
LIEVGVNPEAEAVNIAVPAALLRHILDELFGDGSQQHSVYGDPRGLLTSRKTQKDATDPGTTIGFAYDARGNLLTR